MNRFQIEKLYKINGLIDYKLLNTDDLLKCHGIDYKEVKGYNRLDDINRAIYKKFIVNMFNGLGLESRATLYPKGICFVEEIEYLGKENPEDDFYMTINSVVYSIDRNGLKSVLHTWVDKENKHLEVLKTEIKNYLRFEYEHQGRKEWLHVIKEGKEWY